MVRKVVIVFCSFCLAAAIAVQLLARHAEITDATRPALKAMLPSGRPGWTSEVEAVASTPEMQRKVDELLDYTDATVKTFRRGNSSLSVYVAYWNPRKIHPRLISLHAPDICWVAAGWKMEKLPSLQLPVGDGTATIPGQYRTFQAGGQKLYVAYWHMVGKKINDYTDGTASEKVSVFDSFWADLATGQPEQYFIRIAGTEPLPQMLQDSPLPDVLADLARTGFTAARLP